MTNRLAKWSKEAQEFFEKAEDNSIVLDLVISYGTTSQNGEGFEELINAINSEDIKRKVKKVVITDTSYLYRHNISQFSGYCDVNIPTEWYLRNKEAIEKLTVNFELKSWFAGLQKDGFNDWYKQIKEDFVNDVEFKNVVIDMANSALLKLNENGDIGKNIDFILEETAYTCLHFSNVNMVYPMPISVPVKMAIEKYNLSVHHLSYTISWYAQENKALVLDRNKVNNEIIKFITRDATNVNFFVMGKNGDIIYKNSSLSTVVTEWNAKNLDPQTWDNSLLVMKENKQMIFEETDKHKDFLSVKAPLVINNKVEGVIGLAVDITDRKRAEELERKLAIEKVITKELYEIERLLVDDFCSPELALYMFHKLCKDRLCKEERNMLEMAMRRIREIPESFIARWTKYK